MARFQVMVDNTYGDAAYTKLRLQKHHAGLPESVMDDMLRAQAEIVAEKQRENAKTMLNERGQSKGYTADSITVGNPYTRDGVRCIQIRFKGKRPDGKRAAEVAFLNEYGAGGGKNFTGVKISARGFIWKANRDASDEALAAASKIADDYWENN